MARKWSLLIAISLVLMVLSPSIGSPYVLPSAQIIEFMTNRFAALKTIKILQVTTIKDFDHETDKAFGEIVEVMSPDFYRADVAGQPGTRLIVRSGSRTLRVINGTIVSGSERDHFLYPFLFVAQDPRRILRVLQNEGIRLDTVSLTRFDGKIAYLIGDKVEGSPRLLVEKDRFLPLQLVLDDFSVQFSDYREIGEETWYPHQIVYSSYGIIVEEYSVQDITINPPLDVTQFSIPLIRSQFSTSGP
jgi:hypothetical protein